MLGAITQMQGNLPPVCLCWCAALVGSAILTQYNPELKKDLFLHWTSVIRKGQYWRLLTTFLCFGGAGGLLYMDFYRLLWAGRQPWLAHRLILSLISLEAWSHPWQLTTLPPLPLPPFPAFFLPPLLLVQNVLLFGTPWRLMAAPFAACIPALVILFLLDSFFDSGIIGRAAGPGRGQQQLNMMFGDGPPRVQKNFVEEIEEDDGDGA